MNSRNFTTVIVNIFVIISVSHWLLSAQAEPRHRRVKENAVHGIREPRCSDVTEVCIWSGEPENERSNEISHMRRNSHETSG